MRSRPHPRSGRREGIGMVEVAITVMLLLIVLASAILAANGGYGAFQAASQKNDLETRLRRALDRVAVELLSVGEEELQPDPSGQFGTADLLYRKAVGLQDTVVQWGDQNRLAFEYSQTDPDDGNDNDGNGLVDEGLLVLTRDVGGEEKRVVLCSGVRELAEGEDADGADDNANGVIDEAGFNVHRVGEVLFLILTLEEPGENGPITRTLQTSVRLRN